jgi:hypothetical protein
MFAYIMDSKSKKVVYLFLVVACGLPFVNSSSALLLGFITTLLMGENPFGELSHKWSNYLQNRL